MFKSPKFWFFIIIVSLSFLTGLLYFKQEGLVTKSNQANWNGIRPGTTTVEEIIKLKGSPLSSKQDGTKNYYAFSSNNENWPIEVQSHNNIVTTIQKKVFSPESNSLKEKIQIYEVPPTKLFGPESYMGIYLFVFLENGAAFIANEEQDYIFEEFYFIPTTIEIFLTFNFTKNYSLTEQAPPQQEYPL